MKLKSAVVSPVLETVTSVKSGIFPVSSIDEGLGLGVEDCVGTGEEEESEDGEGLDVGIGLIEEVGTGVGMVVLLGAGCGDVGTPASQTIFFPLLIHVYFFPP